MLPSHRAEHRVERASAKTAKTALILCAAALSCAVLFDGLSVRHTAVSNIDLAVHLGGDGDTGARALTSATLTNPSRIFGARLGSLRCDIHGAPDDDPFRHHRARGRADLWTGLHARGDGYIPGG